MESLYKTFVVAAKDGDKKKVKRLLQQGAIPDWSNEHGNTALHFACLNAHASVVEMLLRNGADANKRNNQGATPLHCAATGGSSKIFKEVISAGGDLRLHDYRGRDIIFKIHSLADAKKQQKLLGIVERRKMYAEQLDPCFRTPMHHFVFRHDSGDPPMLKRRHSFRDKFSSSFIHNLGFGLIYHSSHWYGAVTTIPVVRESSLAHDEFGESYLNGHMVMESMLLNNKTAKVTVKRLHKSSRSSSNIHDKPTSSSANIDLLIDECKYIARIRHPNILLLMAQCHTSESPKMALIYERVHLGSLYHFLYKKMEVIDTDYMCELLKQICDAVLYLHQYDLIHCAITPHAIHIVDREHAKLGNFEYMIHNVEDGCKRVHGKLMENQHDNAMYSSVCNWLAPEILAGRAPTVASDLYSLVCVMWEIQTGSPPWHGRKPTEIKIEIVQRRNTLPITGDVEPAFNIAMTDGLCLDPGKRAQHLSVHRLRNMLHYYQLDQEEMSTRRLSHLPLVQRRVDIVKRLSIPSATSAVAEQVCLPDGSVTTSSDEATLVSSPQPAEEHASDSEPRVSTPKSSDVAQSSDSHEHDVIVPTTAAPPPQLQDITFNNESIIAKDAVLEQSSSRRSQTVSRTSAQPTPSSDTTTKKKKLKSQESGVSSDMSTSKKTRKQKSDESGASSMSLKNRLKKLRSDDSTDGSKSRKSASRLNSSVLRNAAKRMFKKSRSDTDETTASENDDKRGKGAKSDKSSKRWGSRRRNRKSSPSEPSVSDKRKSSGESHVTSARAVAAEPALQNTTELQLESDQDSQNSTNPFRKFMSGRNEDILSEEIKQILAKPITMPKLPSHFSRLSMNKKEGPSVYNTLVRHASQLSARKQFRVTSHNSNSLDRSAISAEGRDLNASSVSHTLSNLSAMSNIKPASHHTPDKPETQPKPPQHFAFLHQQRSATATAPGNVLINAIKLSASDLTTASTRTQTGIGAGPYGISRADVSLNRSAVRKVSLNRTPSISIATQTEQNTLPGQLEHRSLASVLTSRDSEDFQTRSHRDVFFGVKSADVATTYRSDTSLGLCATDASTQQSPPPKPPRVHHNTVHRSHQLLGTATPSPVATQTANQPPARHAVSHQTTPRSLASSRVTSSQRSTAHSRSPRVLDRSNSTVKDMASHFQGKVDEHFMKQAVLVKRHKFAGDEASPQKQKQQDVSLDSSSVFHTPAHLKQLSNSLPRRQPLNANRVQEVYRSTVESQSPQASVKAEHNKDEATPEMHRSTASIVMEKPVHLSTNVTRRSDRAPDAAKSAHAPFQRSSSSSSGGVTTPTAEAVSAPNVHQSPARRARAVATRRGAVHDVSSLVEGDVKKKRILRQEYYVDVSESSSNEKMSDHDTHAMTLVVTDATSACSTPSSCALPRNVVGTPGSSSCDVISVSPPSVHAHGSNSAMTTFDITKPIVRMQLDDRARGQQRLFVCSSSETDDETTDFVNRVIQKVHREVSEERAVQISRSDIMISNYVHDVIEQVRGEIEEELASLAPGNVAHVTAQQQNEANNRSRRSPAATDASPPLPPPPVILSDGSIEPSDGTNRNNETHHSSSGGGVGGDATTDADIEEIYMDDELNESLQQDKYMRLQCDVSTTPREQTTPSAGDYNLNDVLRQGAIFSAPGSAVQNVTSPQGAGANDSMQAAYTPSVLSSGRFKETRQVTRVTSDEGESSVVSSDGHDSSGVIDV